MVERKGAEPQNSSIRIRAALSSRRTRADTGTGSGPDPVSPGHGTSDRGLGSGRWNPGGARQAKAYSRRYNEGVTRAGRRYDSVRPLREDHRPRGQEASLHRRRSRMSRSGSRSCSRDPGSRTRLKDLARSTRRRAPRRASGNQILWTAKTAKTAKQKALPAAAYPATKGAARRHLHQKRAKPITRCRHQRLGTNGDPHDRSRDA